MQFRLCESNTPAEAYKSNELLRLFYTDRVEKDFFSSSDGWVKADAGTVGEWSAIGYLAGNEISERKGIAVGVIACYQGASVIESWVPAGAFESRGTGVPPEQRFVDHTHERYGAWNGDGFLYENALSQVIPYSLSGVVWYQGESDVSAEEGAVYADELRALIDVWRNDFRDPRLPFVVIQIADHVSKNRPGWTLVQAAQAEVGETVEGVKTVVCRDICENIPIHPPSKLVLSARVAQALAELSEKS